MPSFDVVSKTDLNEVENALRNVAREIATRFDFKNSKCSIERLEAVLTIHADDQTKLRQMHELLKAHLVRRKVDPAALEFKDEERASGDMIRQVVVVKQGIAQELAKRLVKDIKDAKLKVQAAIQGDELRVSSKSRDELQRAITLLRAAKVDQPLQYVNFRE
jgi:cyclic-di-GMP-binding protein